MTMQQLDLDSVPKIDTTRKAARRAALEAAKARADAGIHRAAGRADRERPNWCEDATEALRRFAVAQGGVFIVEHARLALVQSGAIDKPSEGRSWGIVTRMAIRREYIERVKGQFFPAASSNASPKAVYRRGPKA